MITNKKKLIYILIIVTISLIGCNKSNYNDNSDYTRNDNITKIKSGEEITFFITTDIHYLAKDLSDGGEAFKKFVESGDGKELGYIDEITDAFIYDISNKKPEVLIISGDLTNNGEKESHIELRDKLKRIEELGTKVYVIPGNHDILNPWAIGFKGSSQYRVENIDEKEFKKIYGDFGYNEAILRDKDTLSYLASPSEDIWLLMIDTNNYKNNKDNGYPQGDGSISSETLEWIKSCIEYGKKMNAEIIPVMHHSLINHSDVVNYGYTLDNNDDILELFSKNNINIALTGHVHIQDISSYKYKIDKSKPNTKDLDYDLIYDIATSSLSVYPQKYGILKYSPQNNSYDYSTSWVDVEGWGSKVGINDKNINNFKEYSMKSFGNKSYNMTYENLSKYNNFTHFEKNEISETIKTLNINYFNGTEHLNTENTINSFGFNLLKAKSQNFLRNYAISISKDNDINDNRLYIQRK